jgi:hypothetical protein
MLAGAVYILCALTALACAVLLLQGYRRSRMRLLLWACLCFAGLTVNNALLYVDLVVAPSIDLSVPRTLVAVASVTLLVFGLIWDVPASDGPSRRPPAAEGKRP